MSRFFIAALTSVVALSGTALAQTGSSSMPESGTILIAVEPTGTTIFGGGSLDAGDADVPNLGAGGMPRMIQIGYDLDGGITPVGGIFLRRVSGTADVDGGATTKTSNLGIGIDLGLRYYAVPREERMPALYVFGDVFFAFQSASIDFENLPAGTTAPPVRDQEDVNAATSDFGGFRLGVGGEYEFGGGFGLGTNVGFVYTQNNIEIPGTPKVDVTLTDLSTVANLVVNWRF